MICSERKIINQSDTFSNTSQSFFKTISTLNWVTTLLLRNIRLESRGLLLLLLLLWLLLLLLRLLSRNIELRHLNLREVVFSCLVLIVIQIRVLRLLTLSLEIRVLGLLLLLLNGVLRLLSRILGLLLGLELRLNSRILLLRRVILLRILRVLLALLRILLLLLLLSRQFLNSNIYVKITNLLTELVVLGVHWVLSLDVGDENRNTLTALTAHSSHRVLRVNGLITEFVTNSIHLGESDTSLLTKFDKISINFKVSRHNIFKASLELRINLCFI